MVKHVVSFVVRIIGRCQNLMRPHSGCGNLAAEYSRVTKAGQTNRDLAAQFNHVY
jgi:hypothetical protein